MYLYKSQAEQGLHFLHEHPTGTTSWKTLQVKELLDLPNVRRIASDMCALGMTTNVSQMARSMEDMADNIAEDRGVLEMMRAEAGGTQEAFLGVLEEYLSGTAPDGEAGQQGGMGGYQPHIFVDAGGSLDSSLLIFVSSATKSSLVARATC